MHTMTGGSPGTQSPGKAHQEIAPKLWWGGSTLALLALAMWLLLTTMTAIAELTISEVMASARLLLVVFLVAAALVGASRVFVSFRRGTLRVSSAQLGQSLVQQDFSLVVLNATLHSGTGTYHVVAQRRRKAKGVLAVIGTARGKNRVFVWSQRKRKRIRRDAKMLEYTLNRPVAPILVVPGRSEGAFEWEGVWEVSVQALPDLLLEELRPQKGFNASLLRNVQRVVQSKS